MTIDPRSYCERQADAILVICASCRRAVFMVVPQATCQHCRTGSPALGQVQPTVLDVSGHQMFEP